MIYICIFLSGSAQDFFRHMRDEASKRSFHAKLRKTYAYYTDYVF
jgi:hypothetical protein